MVNLAVALFAIKNQIRLSISKNSMKNSAAYASKCGKRSYGAIKLKGKGEGEMTGCSPRWNIRTG
jgi:hypothetical protein